MASVLNQGLNSNFVQIDQNTIYFESAGTRGNGSFNVYLPQYKRWQIDTRWRWSSGQPGPNYYSLTKTPFSAWIFPYVEVEPPTGIPERVVLMEPKQIWPYEDIWTPIFNNQVQAQHPDIRYSTDQNQNLQYEFQYLHWSASLQSDMGTIKWENRIVVYVE